MKYFSLFSGIGGFELGFPKHWECAGYSETDKWAIKIYQRHFPAHKNYGDARTINPVELPDLDLLCGGFPCQSFSVAGKRRGFEDTRGTLFFEIARIAKAKRPSYLFLENVKGLLSSSSGSTFATIIKTLSELGYDLQWECLNSKHFGVPQNRERVFIIGHLRTLPQPQIFPIKESNRGSLEAQRKPPKETTRFRGKNSFPNIRTGGGNQTGLYMILKDNLGGNIKQRVRDIENPSWSLGGSETLIQENTAIRRLTPLECERLQGFPDNWTEGVSDTQRYRCLSNAVTVNVIKIIASKLKQVEEAEIAEDNIHH